MKNWFYTVLLSSILAVGCINPEIAGTVERQAARCDNMVDKIDLGKTTREEEQAFIRANRIVWWSMHHDMNDAELPHDVKELLDKLKSLSEKEE